MNRRNQGQNRGQNQGRNLGQNAARNLTEPFVANNQSLGALYARMQDTPERRAERIKLAEVVLQALAQTRSWRGPSLGGSMVYGCCDKLSDIDIGIYGWKTTVTEETPGKIRVLDTKISQLERRLEPECGTNMVKVEELTNAWILNWQSSGATRTEEEILAMYGKFRDEYLAALAELEELKEERGVLRSQSPLSGFNKSAFIKRFHEFDTRNEFSIIRISIHDSSVNKLPLLRLLISGKSLDDPFEVDVSFDGGKDIGQYLSMYSSDENFVFLVTFLKFLLRKKGMFGTANGHINGITIALLVLAYMSHWNADYARKTSCVLYPNQTPNRIFPGNCQIVSLDRILRSDFELKQLLLSFVDWIVTMNREGEDVGISMLTHEVFAWSTPSGWYLRPDAQQGNYHGRPEIWVRNTLAQGENCAAGSTNWRSVVNYLIDLRHFLTNGGHSYISEDLKEIQERGR